MNAAKKIVGVISSKEFLLWLAGVWIFCYVTLAFFVGEAFGMFMVSLQKNLLVRVPYVLFIIGAILNLIRVFQSRWQRGRAYALLSVILPLGVIVFLSGFLLSASYRQAQWIQVREGQTVRPFWSKSAFMLTNIKPVLKKETLQAEESGAIFDYEPKITLGDWAGRSHEVGAFPPAKIGDTYFHILNFGLAPGVRLESEGRVLEERYVMLRILPPGWQDTFELEPYPYRFSLRIAPDRILQKGDEKLKLYNLDRPTYEVEVRRGDKALFEGKTSEGRVVFEGAELSFMKPTYWVLLDVARDPGRPVLLWGIAIISVGLPLWLVSLISGKRKAD